MYDALSANPTRWFNHTQLMRLTGKSTKAVCWGLLYLQRQGLIESGADGLRNPRYRVYRLAAQAAPPLVSQTTKQAKPNPITTTTAPIQESTP